MTEVKTADLVDAVETREDKEAFFKLLAAIFGPPESEPEGTTLFKVGDKVKVLTATGTDDPMAAAEVVGKVGTIVYQRAGFGGAQGQTDNLVCIPGLTCGHGGNSPNYDVDGSTDHWWAEDSVLVSVEV